MHTYLFVFLFIGVFSNAYAKYDDDEDGIGSIISRYFKTSENSNIPIVEFSYGPELLTFHEEFNSIFELNFTTELQYGFFRYDNELSNNGLIYYSSERAFLNSSSSRFKIGDVSEKTIKTDMYRYGGLYHNGFGYGTPRGNKFLFSHSSAIFWMDSDIENFAISGSDNALLDKYEKENNFGMFYSSGVMYVLGNGVTSIELKYTHNIVWADFQFFDWFGSWLLENLLQRSPDLFHEYFIEEIGYIYPVIYQLYKTGISYLIYENRSKNSYFPFGDVIALTQRNFKLGVKFAL